VDQDGNDDAPEAPRSRVRAKVNRPAPRTQSFGTGEPGFVKAAGRSPGSDPAVESSRLPAGTLPNAESVRPFELAKPPGRPRFAFLRRLKETSVLERLLLLALAFGTVFVVLIVRSAHARSHP
jgi:hypothetical protein